MLHFTASVILAQHYSAGQLEAFVRPLSQV